MLSLCIQFVFSSLVVREFLGGSNGLFMVENVEFFCKPTWSAFGLDDFQFVSM